MMRRLFATVAVVLWTLGACAPEAPSTKGTRTNWLMACNADGECGTELSCTCGICTVPCSADDQCVGDEAGVCGSALATALQCGGESAEPICVPEQNSGCTESYLLGDADMGEADVSDCEVAQPLVCQDFDGPLPEWVGISVGNRVALQDCEAARGAGALRFDGEHTQVRIPFASTVADGAFHLRAFVRLSPDLEFDSDFLTMLTIWAGADSEEDTSTVKLTALPNDGLQLHVGSNTTGEQNFDGSAADIVRDEWHCLELAMEVDDTVGSASVALDGVVIHDLTGLDTRAFAPYDGINVTNFTGQTAGELYVDDLVIAREPIGCD